MKTLTATLACVWALSGAALAQAPQAPVSYTGALVSQSDAEVTLQTKTGPVTVPMTLGWTVSTPRKTAAAAIMPGDFIASANKDLGPTSGRSTEVRILEPGYRPENSTHPMGPPAMSITHGTVAKSEPGPDGQQLTVTFPAGSRELLVPPEAPVTAYDLHPRSTLTPGVTVNAVTRKGPDGVARASRLVIVPAT
ncbi:MAG TPA: hypothetical protein VMU59_03590 [Caulobacteraceae bacterium]|nr:hypothetical protein [Caulobacteraceae bacterium]